MFTKDNQKLTSSQTVALFRSWAAEQVSPVAPPLFESEADSVRRRYIYQGLLDEDAGKAAQDLLGALPITIVGDVRVRDRARQIAESFNQDRVYDATYSALAELLGCEFWTADRVFHRAVRGSLHYVRFIEEYVASQG